MNTLQTIETEKEIINDFFSQPTTQMDIDKIVGRNFDEEVFFFKEIFYNYEKLFQKSHSKRFLLQQRKLYKKKQIEFGKSFLGFKNKAYIEVLKFIEQKLNDLGYSDSMVLKLKRNKISNHNKFNNKAILIGSYLLGLQLRDATCIKKLLHAYGLKKSVKIFRNLKCRNKPESFMKVKNSERGNSMHMEALYETKEFVNAFLFDNPKTNAKQSILVTIDKMISDFKKDMG